MTKKGKTNGTNDIGRTFLNQHVVFVVKALTNDDSGELNSCPLCKRAKLHKASRSSTDASFDPATAQCWDHIQVDFGFMVQKLLE